MTFLLGALAGAVFMVPLAFWLFGLWLARVFQR